MLALIFVSSGLLSLNMGSGQWRRQDFDKEGAEVGAREILTTPTSPWKSSSPQLKSLEVSFNNILRKIWSLPRHSHTGIVHSVARLQSLYNVVLSRSKALITSVKKSSSAMIRDIFF